MAKKKGRKGKPKLPPEFLKKIKSVTAKRAKTVIDHILKHGFITTEELKTKYGYDHPPRAARDVREQGFPLETFRVRSSSGRSIGAYRFGDPSKIKAGREAGRTVWPKDFKKTLIDATASKCAICNTKYDARYLQIDHRVPYEVGGEPAGGLDPKNFMLVCASCNRAKSWSCEHCQNWLRKHSVAVCETCYWASPMNYLHIALRLIRRLDITWTENEVQEYEILVEMSETAELELPEYVKDVLRRAIGPN